MSEKRQIFQEKSLAKLSSADRLDQVLEVVKPRSWLLSGAIAIGLVLAVVWGFLGRIPITVSGTGILVRPQQVVPLQAPASGTIATLDVAVGDRVEKGAVIARLRLPELEKELEEELARLDQFDARSAELSAQELQVAEEERRFLSERRRLLEDRRKVLQETAERVQATSALYFSQQKKNVETANRLSEEIGRDLEDRLEAYETAVDGVVTRDQRVAASHELIDNQLRVAEIEVKAGEVDLAEKLAQESFNQKLDQVKDLGIQLQDLELRELEIKHRLLQRKLDDRSEQQSIRRTIEVLEARLSNQGRVVSEHAGRILELTASIGQLVPIGTRVGKLEIEDSRQELKAVAYFDVKDGKKLRPNLGIRIAPSTIRREKHGSILGRVASVSDYAVSSEGAANQIGDLELARSLLGGENRIEVIALLERDATSPTRYAWTSGRGPEDLSITAGTTAEVRVTIEERAPITLILPFLRSLGDS